MTKSFSFAILAGAMLVSGTAAVAATQAQTKPAATKITATKTVATKTVKPKTVATSTTTTKTTTPMGNTKVATRTTTVAKGRMVSAKLANGKTVTYNCSLAGNKTKTACK